MTNTNTNGTSQENGTEAPVSGDQKDGRGASGKVRPVSRSRVTSRKRNKRDEVPGVSENTGRDPDEGVREGGAEVVTRSLAALTPLQKVALLNGYKDIFSDIPKAADNHAVWIYQIIKAEYQKWVAARISELFGDAGASAAQFNQFTEEEAASLKALARAVIQRKNNPQQPAAPQPRAPQGGGPQPANTGAYIRAQEDFLTQLARLEREGPTF